MASSDESSNFKQTTSNRAATLLFTVVVGAVLLVGVDKLMRAMQVQETSMQGKVVNVDSYAKTFVINQKTFLFEHKVDGPMHLGVGENVSITYLPSKHWFKLFWQDPQEIQIEVARVIEP